MKRKDKVHNYTKSEKQIQRSARPKRESKPVDVQKLVTREIPTSPQELTIKHANQTADKRDEIEGRKRRQWQALR